jgi:hypothetical protein
MYCIVYSIPLFALVVFECVMVCKCVFSEAGVLKILSLAGLA